MSTILVGVYDEHRLLQEGISELLKNIPEIEITIQENSMVSLFRTLESRQPHILIMNMHAIDITILKLFKKLASLYPRMKVLVISTSSDEQTIMKTVKSGAQGILANECTRQDLMEALYTLRNGYDYYSKSITNLLLKRYISDLKDDTPATEKNEAASLSARELEILKLWGNGNTNKEVSEKLFISIRTVESHKNHIMQKLNIKTAVDLVKFGIKNNLIEV